MLHVLLVATGTGVTTACTTSIVAGSICIIIGEERMNGLRLPLPVAGHGGRWARGCAIVMVTVLCSCACD